MRYSTFSVNDQHPRHAVERSMPLFAREVLPRVEDRIAATV